MELWPDESFLNETGSTVMKVLTSKFGPIFRLSISAATLLLAQQALGAGTAPGTDVDNTATVTWSVGGTQQTPFDAIAPTFVVDRRVDFTLTPDGTSDIVNPGDTGLTFDFTLASTGNSELDFAVTFTQLAPGDIVNTFDDSGADLTVGGTPLSTVYVDNLAEDGSTTITLTGDAAAALVNGDVANIRVTVTALDAGGTSAAPVALANTDASADDPNAIDNVFANPDGLGVESADDGIRIEAAILAIAKATAVFWDPINLLANAKAVPGAVIEYTISIDNTGPVIAQAISILDVINLPVVFLNAANNPVTLATEPYGTGNVSFFDGTTTTTCLAETGGGDTNSDGCVLTGTTLTIAPTPAVDVAATTGTLDISFQVLVP